MNWFRMYGEFATDPKVQMLSESDQRRLCMLFCIRCSNGDVTLHDGTVVFQLRISSDEWDRTKALFIDRGFIDSDNRILNWSKRQYRSDSSAERVAAHRARVKQETVTPCNVTATPPEADTDTDTEEQKKKNTRAKRAPAPRPELLADVSEQIAADFTALRKQKRAPLTATAIDGIRREATKAGLTLDAALAVCCERGWTGFRADWDWRATAVPQRTGATSKAGQAIEFLERLKNGKQKPDSGANAAVAMPRIGTATSG